MRHTSTTEQQTQPATPVPQEVEQSTPDLNCSSMTPPRCEEQVQSISSTIKSSGDDKLAPLIKYSALMQDFPDHKSHKLLSSVYSIIMDPAFDVELFRKTFPSMQSSKHLLSKQFDEKVISEGFHKDTVTFSDGHESHTASMYHKNAISCLKKQLDLCTENDIVMQDLSSTTDNANNDERFNHPLETPFFRDRSRDIRRAVIASDSKNSIWFDDDEKKSMVGYIQIFTDKTKAALKSDSFAAHAVHVTYMNFSKAFRRKMIQAGHTLIGFLPVSLDSTAIQRVQDDTQTEHYFDYKLLREIETEEFDNNSDKLDSDDNTPELVQLLDGVHLTTQAKGRHIKQELIYRSMKKILSPLMSASTTGFPYTRSSTVTWYIFPHLMSYCCDIPEAKDMSAVRHNLSTMRPCHRCFITCLGIKQGCKAGPRTLRQTNWIRRMKKESGEKLKDLLKGFSVAPWKSFLEDVKKDHPNFLPDSLYEIFTFEPLHNLHLGISKLLKTCTFHLVSSKKQVIFKTGHKSKQQQFASKKVPILSGCNTYLRCMERDNGVPDLHVDFSSKDASDRLNGIFLQTGLRGMLEGKDYRKLDTVFPFVASFIDTISGSETAELTRVHMQYTEIILALESIDNTTGIDKTILADIQNKITAFKQNTINLFAPHISSGLFTLKFHLLDHLVEDLTRFAGLDVLSASPYEYYNTRIKYNYRLTSKRRATCMDETVQNLDDELASLRNTTSQHTGKSLYNRAQGLVRHGVTANLRELRTCCSPMTERKRTHLRTELDGIIPHTDRTVLLRLIEEQIGDLSDRFMDYQITITFVKSGIIESFKTPTLDDYCQTTNLVKYTENNNHICTQKRVFATNSFGPSKTQKHSSIFLKGADAENGEHFWFAKTLLLFYIQCDHPSQKSYHKEFAFVRFYECTKPATVSEKLLNCICLRWETADGVDYSTKSSENSEHICTSENYGVIPFSSICGITHVIRSNYAIKPFIPELPWTHHRFHVNRFYT